jgi:hypothetical protein
MVSRTTVQGWLRPSRKKKPRLPLTGLRRSIISAWDSKIVCWDDISIRRASRDSKAGFYGAFLWAISATATLLVAIPRIPMNKQVPVPVQTFALLVGLAFALVLMGVITFIQYALSHLIAKWFFGATGTLVPIMRPLLLA